jgi:excisionase family DNA binding protein
VTDLEELAAFAALALAKQVRVSAKNGKHVPASVVELAALLLRMAAPDGAQRPTRDRPAKGPHNRVMADPLLLTTVDVARLLAVSERTVRAMAADGRLTAVRIGGSVRYRRADIEALIAASPRSFRDVVAAKDSRVGGARSRSGTADPIHSGGTAA